MYKGKCSSKGPSGIGISTIFQINKVNGDRMIKESKSEEMGSSYFESIILATMAGYHDRMGQQNLFP